MEVEKPAWLENMRYQTRTSYNPEQYNALVTFEHNGGLSYAVDLRQILSAADFKEMGIAFYHLGLWLEQQKCK